MFSGLSSRSTIWIIAVYLMGLGLGCGGDGNSPGPDVGTDTGTHDAQHMGPDLSGTCDAEDCPIVWTETESFPTGVDHHTTGILDAGESKWLIVAGGHRTENQMVETRFSNVTGARIQPDGSLGEWREFGSFAGSLSFHGQVNDPDGGLIYMGGISAGDGGDITANLGVLAVSIEDGELQTTVGTEMERVFRHPTAHIVHDRIVVIGGFSATQTEVQAAVSTSPMTDEGVNGAWSEAPDLPQPRALHTSVVHEGSIYVFGGFNQNTNRIADILRSTHANDGSLTGWEVVGQWEDARWTATAFVHGDHAYLLGGGTAFPGDPFIHDTITRVELTEDGIGTIEDIEEELPTARSHVHQAPMLNGRVYSVGGQTGRGSRRDSIPSVFVGHLVGE